MRLCNEGCKALVTVSSFAATLLCTQTRRLFRLPRRNRKITVSAEGFFLVKQGILHYMQISYEKVLKFPLPANLTTLPRIFLW